MTINVFREFFRQELEHTFPIDEVNSFFYMLCAHHLGKSRIEIALEPNAEMSPSTQVFFNRALQKLKEAYPIQYLLGTTEFMELELEVNEQVLIPRPETEELIRWICDPVFKSSKLRILDIGTGSGCIPIALAKYLPNSHIDAIDISEAALAVAQRNSKKHQVSVKFIQTDILQMEVLPNKYDIIVSNPPYVRESEKKLMHDNVLKYEPDIALYVSDEDPLLFYRHIAKLAFKGLKNKGYLYFEINQYLGNELRELLFEAGYKTIELRKDIHGEERMLRASKN